MNNSITKKQNRILLISLVVILAAATVLVAITGSANKSKKNDSNPPLDNNVSETGETSDTGGAGNEVPDTKDAGNANIIETTDIPVGETEASADVPDDKEVSSVQQNTDVLPTFAAPIDNAVLKGFSIDVPVFSYTMNDYRTHSGLDFACSPGTPVLAAADGTVCEIVDDPMMGVTVAVQHTGGAVTKYKGLSEDSMDLCKVGDTVERGQVIGASGDTALIESAEESHLHFELYVNGEAQNPADYMAVTYLSDMSED